MDDDQSSSSHDLSGSEDEFRQPAKLNSSWITLVVSYRGTKYNCNFPDDAVIKDLFVEIEETFSIPLANQKIMGPKGLLLKHPHPQPDLPLRTIAGRPLMLMGSQTADVQAVQDMSERIARRNAARMASASRARHATPRRDPRRAAEDSRYTFLQVRPLQGLPHPERSQALLMRLKQDPGIRAAMRKHKFSVSLLTEMEPLSHTQTTHEGTSRTLGLNRNQGEVIELRLRTDAHDGYRDYKTIRKTLCHELAHNVHGPHDRNFWDLCHQIEREVDAADWKSGGQTISGDVSRYTISGQGEEEEDMHEDDGGWTGGEFVLGGVAKDGGSSSGGGGGSGSTEGLSRREILAQAALERQRKEAEAERNADNGWRPCQRPPQSSDQAD
ncbi:ubiquitin/metalloprotease fusion protein [Stachybotrys elegans]|uniref:Ubiquitin/metalloprotease fusion protein n=1 Tax=Stachybotrys elegans TaxID=80388 RepID=A0A8K0SV45_9HYPO|nr:ubiquitin/metalloprotease fusion protein [Stachybotrys elegans]